MIPLSLACTARRPFLYQNDPDAVALAARQIPMPDTSFFVLSDTHLYDTGLGTSGAAFQDYLNRDRKLLVLSDDIIGAAVKAIAKQKADFLLVCGDLTKDGEMVCHKAMAAHLKVLKESGKKIFVVPGNHDISNPEAVRFSGGTTAPVPTAGPGEFETIYREFGYGDAIARDTHSLSYTAEPVEGLRLLALDSCRYKENRPGHHPVTGGAFSKETMAWIEQQLIAAKQSGKATIAMLHHGIMEHYPDNKKFYDEYIVADDESVAGLLGAYGVSLVFTGHFHAQDITRKKVPGPDDTPTQKNRMIFDIETGSLVTAPCPYRKVTFTGGDRAVVQSAAVTAIPSMGEKFAAYADRYVFDGTLKLADTALAKYKVGKEQAGLINHQIAKAYMAHLKGDELPPPVPLDKEGFGLWLKFIAWMQEDLIHGWWTDLPPADNNLVIHLGTGKVSPVPA
ncbi:MAG: metallophosphoesterase [Desulfobacter sp.]|nr:MAG: metallophosphoesterase [Desulfobacter sp.]